MTTNAMPSTEMDTMLTAVRQFAVGLPGGTKPSEEVVDQAERLVHAAFNHTVEPEHHCMDDGDLGWIMELPNEDRVFVLLSPEGKCLWGHAKEDKPEEDGYAQPGNIDEIIALLEELDVRPRESVA